MDQTGLVPSQGWYKGLEMCAHLHSWFMLQDNLVGATPITTEPAAYFEVRGGEGPFEAGKAIKFNARGSHAFANVQGTRLVPKSDLRFKWSFGDGSRARGNLLKHTYKKPGNYSAVLTVISPAGTDTMTLLIKIGAPAAS